MLPKKLLIEVYNDDGYIVTVVPCHAGRQLEALLQPSVLQREIRSAGAAAEGVSNQMRGTVLVQRLLRFTEFSLPQVTVYLKR